MGLTDIIDNTGIMRIYRMEAIVRIDMCHPRRLTNWATEDLLDSLQWAWSFGE
jgi:hypothetical protein